MDNSHLLYRPPDHVLSGRKHYHELWEGLPRDVRWEEAPSGKGTALRSARPYIWVPARTVEALAANPDELLLAAYGVRAGVEKVVSVEPLSVCKGYAGWHPSHVPQHLVRAEVGWRGHGDEYMLDHLVMVRGSRAGHLAAFIGGQFPVSERFRLEEDGSMVSMADERILHNGRYRLTVDYWLLMEDGEFRDMLREKIRNENAKLLRGFEKDPRF